MFFLHYKKTKGFVDTCPYVLYKSDYIFSPF